MFDKPRLLVKRGMACYNRPMLALHFHITASAYRQVIAWRTQAEMTIIRYMIETQGWALVIWREPPLGPGHHLSWKINEMPEPGTCEPYVGETGGGNRYTFHPLDTGGCELIVSRTSNGVFGRYPGDIPPLCITIPDPARLVSLDLGGRHSPVYFYNDPEEGTRPDLFFQISGNEIEKFVEWAGPYRSLSEFEFSFIPLSCGIEMFARRNETGEENHLTCDVGW